MTSSENNRIRLYLADAILDRALGKPTKASVVFIGNNKCEDLIDYIATPQAETHDEWLERI